MGARHVARRRRTLRRRARSLLALVAIASITAVVVALAAPGGSGSAGWDGFGPGNWPGASWRPYAPSSPFNTAIGRARVHPRSAALVAGALQWGPPAPLTAGEADTPDDFGHPVYFAQPGDPLYSLHPTESSWGHNVLAGARIRVPAVARPAGGSDAHMTVVEPDGWEYDLWGARPLHPGGGVLDFAWGGRLRIDGSGLGGEATASHFGALAGIIRPEELAAGRIEHALFIVLKCVGPADAFGYGARGSGGRSYVYPASASGSGDCSGDVRNLPPMGARFQLAMSSAQIAALPLPAWKKAILTALARYGGYVGDTGGSGFGFMMQSSSTYTSFGAPDRLVQFARGAGLSDHGGRFSLNIASGVDWARYLRVLLPPPRAHRHR